MREKENERKRIRQNDTERERDRQRKRQIERDVHKKKERMYIAVLCLKKNTYSQSHSHTLAALKARKTPLLLLNYYLLIPVIACGFLEDPINGYVDVTGNTEGSSATYVCDEHTQLVGTEVRKCENGNWTNEEPKCDYCKWLTF